MFSAMWSKEWWTGEQGKRVIPLVFVCFALVFFLWTRQAPPKTEPKRLESVEVKKEELERQLAETLQFVAGVKKVRVWLQLEGTPVYVYEKNVQAERDEVVEGELTNRRETKRTNEQATVVTRRTSDVEEPIILEKRAPKIRGAILVVAGAEDEVIKERVLYAVTRALRIPSYRVAVVPMNPS